jgi:hypothetical protein
VSNLLLFVGDDTYGKSQRCHVVAKPRHDHDIDVRHSCHSPSDRSPETKILLARARNVKTPKKSNLRCSEIGHALLFNYKLTVDTVVVHDGFKPSQLLVSLRLLYQYSLSNFVARDHDGASWSHLHHSGNVTSP